MKVVTFQSKAALDYLNEKGYLICDDKYIDMKKSSLVYKWVIDNMNKNISNNSSSTYPIWCWVKCDDDICPPKVKGKRVEGFDVKITFNVDEKDIFITDFRRFSFILNNLYIPNSKEDKDKFDKLLNEKNISLEELKAYMRKDKYDSHRTDEEFIKVCELVASSFDRCITKDSDVLQGCVWKIDKEQIENIEILEDDGYVYGSLNYVREDGTRRNWQEEYYEMLK